MSTLHLQRPTLPFRWPLPVALIYLIGGTLQYVGLISVTQCNILALVLLSHVFLFRSTWSRASLELPIIVFAAFVIITQLISSPPLENTLTYVYYLACTLIAAVAGRVYANRWIERSSFDKLFRFTTWFLLLQLLVTLLQASFTTTYVSMSRAAIGYEDAIFGTLFLQSDAALATVCELIIILAFVLPCRARVKYLLIGLALAVVFLGNSKAAQACILALTALLMVRSTARALRLTRNGLGILAIAAVLLCGALTFSLWFDQVSGFIQQTQDDYYRRDEWITASRFAPIGQIFSQGLSLFGDGPLTYYNPITKTWLYNAGFSTLYVLYIDYGLLGFCLYFGYQTYLVLKFSRGIIERACFFLVLASFTAFNFALSDLSFVFFFNFALALVHAFHFDAKNPELNKIPSTA